MTRNRIGLIGIPAGVVGIVVMLIVPMPPYVLDVLISLNISAAVIVMLMSMHVKKPLDFSAFPALLLVATMFRLALNVSATRLVLEHGYAGAVIESFGSFVVGGSLIVGLVVFLILIVIQFVVVTAGSGRVAEVAARFTLDGMPGKQMAIDADLNSGSINEAEAKRRRAEISNEADFYGAMDGASKFVRGDAIAAIIITMINLLGGFAVGILQQHLSPSQAVHTYSLLSVGDGLVSQIPALLLSISTGIMVTRASTEDDFGTDVLTQLRRQHNAVRVAAVVMLVLAIIPGLPHIAFLVVGGLLFFASSRFRRSALAPTPVEELVESAPEVDSPAALAGEVRVDPLELELALDLIDLVGDGRRPARPGQGAAAQGGRRPRPDRPARAHPRQPRPGPGHLQHPPARRRGRPGHGAAGTAALHRRRHRGAAGRVDGRARLRAGRQVGPDRAAPAGPHGRRHRGRSLVGHHDAPGRGHRRQRRPAALDPAAAHAARSGQGARAGRHGGDGGGQPRPERAPARPVRAAQRGRAHPRPRPHHRGGERAGPGHQGSRTRCSRRPAARSARPSPRSTPRTGRCSSSRSTRWTSAC